MSSTGENDSLLQRSNSGSSRTLPTCCGCNPRAVEFIIFVSSILSFAAYACVFILFPIYVPKDVPNTTNKTTTFCWNWTSVTVFHSISFDCPFIILGVGAVLSGLIVLGLIVSFLMHAACTAFCMNLDQRPCCQITKSYIKFVLDVICITIILAFLIEVIVYSSQTDKWALTGDIISASNHMWFISIVAGVAFNIVSCAFSGSKCCRHKQVETFENPSHRESVLYRSINYSDI